MKIVPDTSIIISGDLELEIEKNEIKDAEILIPLAVIDELQSQASKHQAKGFIGLENLKQILDKSKDSNISIKYLGNKPTMDDIKLAKSGRIDAIILDVARMNDAILYTGDYVQSIVAGILGVEVNYISQQKEYEKLIFEKFFDLETSSIHIKEDTVPKSKEGHPGNVQLKKIGDEVISKEIMQEIIEQIDYTIRSLDNTYYETNIKSLQIVQLNNYRIAIVKPPLSSALEITIVKPIMKKKLSDYKISEKLFQRISEQAEGILIAGRPGSGKTTLATSIAEYYSEKNKLVKTLESPKDLQVNDDITQYGPIDNDFTKTAELLLLIRPDYTIFDEVRKTVDFKVFTDLRLSGVGMIGVIHANDPINSIQRFIGRLELGIISSVIDTVIFVKDGIIEKTLDLQLSVKVPSGMTDSDLARPVIEIKNFETEELEHEIYTFGDENIVVPIKNMLKEITEKEIETMKKLENILKRYDSDPKIEFIGRNKVSVELEKDAIPKVIGRGGQKINELEAELGVHIEVNSKISSLGKEIKFKLNEKGNSIDLTFRNGVKGKNVNVYVENEYIFSAIVGKKNNIKLSKSSDMGKSVLSGILTNKEIKAVITD